MRSSLLASVSIMLARAAAWNTDVHQQIGYMAETIFKLSTKNVLSQILEPQYDGSIGRAAAWADAYAHTTEGAYSYQWHWIDADDSPPELCNVNYTRDCPSGGCIVSAIANQTSILSACITSLSSSSSPSPSPTTDLTCSNSLKFLTHFLGDITQPLHCSSRYSGGNTLPVRFGPHATELHAVWDGYILYSAANVTVFPNASLYTPFFGDILTRIHNDDFAIPVAEWIECIDISTPQTCAMAWARDSNLWTCEYVYNHNYKFNNETDLESSGYAEGAYPIVKIQLAKAVVRLGTWLNEIVDRNYFGMVEGDDEEEGEVVQEGVSLGDLGQMILGE